jgi:hypothetical protein
MSIWEVRNKKQNFVYSKIMLWVAFDRGLRLAEKRCLPCPNRAKWLAIRDEIYEDVMEKGNYSRLFRTTKLTHPRIQPEPPMLRSKLRKWRPTRLFHLNRPPRLLHQPQRPSLHPYHRPHPPPPRKRRLNIHRPRLPLQHRTFPRRCGWSRRRIQHVHILACRSPYPRRCLRT